MTEKQRYYCKIIFIVFIVLSLFCLSIKPVTQDISAINPTSQLALQGQDSNLQQEDLTEKEQSEETLDDSREEQGSPEEPNTKESPSAMPNQTENTKPPQSQQQPSIEDNAGAAPGPPTTELPPIMEDASTVEVVHQADNNTAYFTTNLMDGMTVTEEAFYVTISQLDESLVVEGMQISLNDEVLDNFNGKLTFKNGINIVNITMYYKKADQSIAVKQTYNVTLNTKDIVIQTTVTNTTVKDERYRFTASASRAGKSVKLQVTINDEAIQPQAGNAYAVILEPGENQFTFTASDNTEKETVEYIVYYQKEQAQLVFDTDLVNQKVSEPKFNFTAKAFYGKESINFIASLNGEEIKATDPYQVQLKNGTNTIQLHASYKGEQLTKQYKILYTDPNVIVTEEKDELAPTIKTDLVSGTHVKGLIKTINVWPTTADGTRIRGKNVAVKVNGVGIPFVWDDAEKTSYKLTLQDGQNNIDIRVWDNDGRVAKESYTLTAENLENQVIGQATISVEASVLGIPYLIPPTKVDIHQGEKGSFIIDQLLRQHGYKYDYTGTLQSNFYLSALKKSNMLANVQIPDDLWLLVEESSSRAIRDDYDLHSLGEFDFANGSGWMFSINGDYPNYGFSDAYFLDGDVIRIRFTLHYGKDIAGFGGMGGGSGSNWGKEW